MSFGTFGNPKGVSGKAFYPTSVAKDCGRQKTAPNFERNHFLKKFGIGVRGKVVGVKPDFPSFGIGLVGRFGIGEFA